MKIAIIATEGRSLFNFRGELIKEWVKAGHEVIAASIEPESEMQEKMQALGAAYRQISGSRTGTNLMQDLKMIRAYRQFFQKEHLDMCFLYMSKPVAYGGIAARWCHVPHIDILISGLEIAFYKKDIKNRIIRIVLILLYRIAMKKADNVFFQNPDDMKRFQKLKIARAGQSIRVYGSGVDMEHFAKKEMPKGGDVILMVGRLVRYKGIYDFVDAAKIVKEKYPSVRFQVLGGIDTNSDSMSEQEVKELTGQGVIEYLGFREDVRPVLEQSTIFVLPSRFEGVPRSTLEAMATGRPVITTDAPGCRETVKEGYNGFLVSCGDAGQLAGKIEILIADHAMRDEMAEHSYELCRKYFDVKKVNRQIMDHIEGMKYGK